MNNFQKSNHLFCQLSYIFFKCKSHALCQASQGWMRHNRKRCALALSSTGTENHLNWISVVVKIGHSGVPLLNLRIPIKLWVSYFTQIAITWSWSFINYPEAHHIMMTYLNMLLLYLYAESLILVFWEFCETVCLLKWGDNTTTSKALHHMYIPV